MTKKPKRVALYLRVSTGEQTTKNQRRELEAVAAHMGWTVTAVFEDAGISGAKGRDDRPAYDALLKAVTRREVDLVVSGPLRALPGRSPGLSGRAAREALRPVSPPAGRRHEHAGRAGAVPDARGVRRVRARHDTGPGKGKTTAAMGTGLRAVGQGMRVLMLQFLKGSWHYGELDAVQAFGDKFVMKQLGRGFVKVGAEKPDPEDVRMVEDAWAEGEKAIQSGQWDLVILDEINYAISYGMLDPAKVVASLQRKPEMVHVILTGRNAHPTIVELADTVTEMRQVKHAYEKGVMAQRGIEY